MDGLGEYRHRGRRSWSIESGGRHAISSGPSGDPDDLSWGKQVSRGVSYRVTMCPMLTEMKWTAAAGIAIRGHCTLPHETHTVMCRARGRSRVRAVFILRRSLKSKISTAQRKRKGGKAGVIAFREDVSRREIAEHSPRRCNPRALFSSIISTPITTLKALLRSFMLDTSTVSGVTRQTVWKSTSGGVGGVVCTSLRAAATVSAPGR